ncbi:GNAT family N-acetyltransferase [Aureliella helgolandensis]|uniref:Putative N-acetyltransferase YjcF n=1 Tax=Aureliella helgolandensis TaxID=2527968 RepID=A0A518GFA6_9BACT|nr:GNAT family N-acetyltransferase [Aureliella helgolandensis]QDV27263.1 putative N-acetyltransferase YjcF [Aureliella helgolandensis]
MYTRCDRYENLANDLHRVRDAVFLIEQGVSAEKERDLFDQDCMHAVAYSEPEFPVATGRIDLQQLGKVGRVAVLKSHRRRGYGTLIMRALEQAARDAQLSHIWFHAQASAVPFYQSLGYQVSGTEFMEAGMEHVRMEKSITD